MVDTYLESALKDINYDNLQNWMVPDIASYSFDKKLFPYQVDAIKNAVKALYYYYTSSKDKDNVRKEYYHNLCIREGLEKRKFDRYKTDDKTNFDFLEIYYEKQNNEKGTYISEIEFFNRMCFWMATASGKTILIVKLIEILDYYMRLGLIPKKDILILFPTEKILNQFKDAINDYNIGKDKPIALYSLKNYDTEARNMFYSLDNQISIFAYRTDLLSDEEKENQIDIKNYEHNGDWYVFMDEAHKGDKEDSIRQNYIATMSRNGFLFNFSATFTDAIDFATTCYNFNLEKFIEARYGKNVYLSETKFKFSRKSDDLEIKDRQLQVIKSIIVFTAIKMAKKKELYHNPLMVTLVNEVNTEDADCDMFFEELAKIATGKITDATLRKAKKELLEEFAVDVNFQFGSEKLNVNDSKLKKNIDKIDLSDILKFVFNSKNEGKIEVKEGEKGKEFALQLETASKPFALFRIGDATQYIKNKLKNNYNIIEQYEEKKYFDNLNNEDSSINILIGSRMFYEGWDSNRPNVMNFINLGKGEATKFVLQSLGRGVRIEPKKGDRQRLKTNDSDKNQLLETLFVFATNRKVFESILDTVDSQKNNDLSLELIENERLFTLLIPYYKESNDTMEKNNKYAISQNAFDKLSNYLNSIPNELLFVKNNYSNDVVNKLRTSLTNKTDYYVIKEEKDYDRIDYMLKNICSLYATKNKEVDGIRELEKEIIHFKKIKITHEHFNEYDEILDFMNSPLSEKLTEKEKKKIAQDFAKGKINENEMMEKLSNAKGSNVKIVDNVLHVIKLLQHYYLPIISTKIEKLDYINHIIKYESEHSFVLNLNKYLESNGDTFDFKWMFSKIDQTVDDVKLAIPYYDVKDNSYHNFYPDFIFWLKKDNQYRIIFVDPKGIEHTSYQAKVDAFEKLFMENGNSKVFKYKDDGKTYDVTFDLRLVCDDRANISDDNKYSKYWFDNNNFQWLKV